MSFKIYNILIMSNWCWWEWGFKPPYRIFFHTSCDKHDELYSKWGNKIDRKIADVYLLEYMKADIINLQPFYKIPYFIVWAYIYYIWVRIWWAKYFNRKD